MSDDNERLRRNDKSRNKATNHSQLWDEEELAFLLEWEGGDDDLAAVAELLGRTIEACREKFYKTRRGHMRVEVRQVTTVTGWLVGFCFECGTFGDVYSDGLVSKCEECR